MSYQYNERHSRVPHANSSAKTLASSSTSGSAQRRVGSVSPLARAQAAAPSGVRVVLADSSNRPASRNQTTVITSSASSDDLEAASVATAAKSRAPLVSPSRPPVLHQHSTSVRQIKPSTSQHKQQSHHHHHHQHHHHSHQRHDETKTKTQMARAFQESKELYKTADTKAGLQTVKHRRVFKKTTTITKGENEKVGT